MALTVGDLVAYLRLDQSDFEKGMGQAESKFSGLQKTFASGAKAVAGTVATVGVAAAGVGLAVFKVGADYNRLQQSSRAALTTLLGSAQAANAQMDKLDAFAKTSPFAKQVFIVAQQQLIGFGLSAEKVVPTLDAIQNAVAAVGGSSEDIGSVTNALATMRSSGKLTGQTLNQLGQYGIDAASIIGEKMGKTGEEITRMASKPGGIPVNKVWDPLVNGLTEKFGGATALIKEQMDGAVDRVKSAFRDIGSAIATPFIDPKGGGQAVVWTNQVANAMRALEAKIIPLVDILVRRFQPQLDKVGPAIDKVADAINRWDLRRVNGQLDTHLGTLSKYAPLVAAAGAAFVTFGAGSIPVLGRFLPAINPVVAAIAALIAASPEMRTVVTTAFESLKPLVPIAGSLGIAIMDVAMAAIDKLAPAFLELVEAAGPVAVTFLQGLVPAASAVLGAALPLVDVIADVVSWVAQLPTPVLLAVAAMVAFQGPLGSVVTTLGGVASTAIKGFNDAMAASRETAGLMGKEVGTVGTVAMTARAGVASLGDALKAAFISNAIGLVIAGVAAAISIFISKNAEAVQRTEDLRATLDETTGAMTDMTDAFMAQQMQSERGFFNSRSGRTIAQDAEELGLSLNTVKEAMLGNVDAMQEVEAAREAHMNSSFADRIEKDEAIKMWDHVTNGIRDNAGSLEEAQERQREFNEITGRGADAQKTAADATRTHSDALKDQQDQLRAGADASLSLAEALLREKDAQDRSSDAIAKYNELAESGTATDKELERAKRDTESAALGLARANDTVTDAMGRNNASAYDLNVTIAEQREKFIADKVAMGMAADEAGRLATQIGLVPNRVAIDFQIGTASAKNTIDQFIKTQSGRVIRVRVEGGTVSYNHGRPGSNVMPALEDGAVRVASYANGNMPTNAIIQAAKPGLVQWAEPSTHGEAFIPLALSKRARSLEIWKETGKRLNAFDVTPFAHGAVNSIITNAPATTSVSNLSTAPNKRTLTDADIRALAQALQRGAEVGTAKGTKEALDGRDQRPSVVIKQTNHNPIDVPVVEQTQKALMMVAAIGDLGNV